MKDSARTLLSLLKAFGFRTDYKFFYFSTVKDGRLHFDQNLFLPYNVCLLFVRL